MELREEMILKQLKGLFYIAEFGKGVLKKAVFACTISQLLQLVPVLISIEAFIEMLRPLNGDCIRSERLILLIVLAITVAVLMYISNIYEHKSTFVMAYHESEKSRNVVISHLRKLSMSFFNAKDLAEITANIMDDCDSIEKVLSHILPQFLATIIATVIVSIVLFAVNWQLACCLVITIPLMFFIIWLSKSIHIRWVKRLTALKLEQEKNVREYIEGIRLIKAYGITAGKYKQLEAVLLRMKKMMIKGEIITGSFFTSSQVILQCGMGLTVFAGIMLYGNGQIELRTLLIFFLMSVRFYAPVLIQLTSLAELMYNRIATHRMRKLLQEPVVSGKGAAKPNDYNIIFENVSFAYEADPVLKKVNAQIKEDEITAIVGPSGSGKSTIARLIPRFWEVDSGRIFLGGTDIRSFAPEDLMECMSIVFQDVVLFNDSVYNNISIGAKNAGSDRVIAAARLARCDQFIAALPDGYHTMLGENGCKLSSGERQRISIARAILKDAPIIILDEATASLDPENEMCVQKAISELIKGKTVIVIAHKLKTIVNADRIIVINNGAVQEAGTHSELMKADGLYKYLFTLQTDSMDWRVKNTALI
jgi:ATP-binding cassette subfamily B protein IrtB